MTPDLRLIVITDDRIAAPRAIEDVVRECLLAGAPVIQLRDKASDDPGLLRRAVALRELCEAHGARLLVNDRLDIALASGAHGVHLGPEDLPPDRARSLAPPGFLIGWSARDPSSAARAAALGADYVGCGPVYGTTSKQNAPAEPLGLQALARVVDACPVPVVGIGGVDPENAADVLAAGAAGVSVIRAVMASPDPGDTVRRLLAARS
ncbi:MAG TPA: thiamine phosphate synthase [Longimicrobiales bacterium]|nr:thiamine phosphate synthase [Longimicrobiales bacterium]